MFFNKTNTKVFKICYLIQKSKCVTFVIINYSKGFFLQSFFTISGEKKGMKNKYPSAISMVLDDFEDLVPGSD